MTYEVEEASGITDQWVLDYVVPHMCESGEVPRQVCLVLGRAALWRLFDPSGDNIVPEEMRARVMARYADLGHDNTLPVGSNPVRKVPLIVDGADSEVLIDRVDYGDDNEGGGRGDDGDAMALDGRQRRALSNAQLRMLTSQGELLLVVLFHEVYFDFAHIYLVAHLRRENADMRLEYERQLVIIRGQMTRLNKNIVRFINRPAHPIRHQQHPPNETHAAALATLNITPAAAPILPPMEIEEDDPAAQIHQGIARLSKCPRSLHELWKEYQVGTGGYKAAKDFTVQERGADKSKYYRRNVFWTKVSELILAGYSSDQACDLIYCSVTKIINKMIADKKEGGHPGLRVVHR